MANEYLAINGKLAKKDGKLVQVPDSENLNDLADTNNALATQSDEVANEIENLIVKSGVINGSPKGVYASLTALKTAYPSGANGVYVTSDNGHWYYWNGTTWTDGGAYRNSENIVQETGTATDKVMSQKAVTEALPPSTDKVSDGKVLTVKNGKPSWEIPSGGTGGSSILVTFED